MQNRTITTSTFMPHSHILKKNALNKMYDTVKQYVMELLANQRT